MAYVHPCSPNTLALKEFSNINRTVNRWYQVLRLEDLGHTIVACPKYKLLNKPLKAANFRASLVAPRSTSYLLVASSAVVIYDYGEQSSEFEKMLMNQIFLVIATGLRDTVLKMQKIWAVSELVMGGRDQKIQANLDWADELMRRVADKTLTLEDPVHM